MLTNQNYDANTASQSLNNSAVENATQTAQNEADQLSEVDQPSDEISQDEPDAFFLQVANNCEASGHLKALLKSIETLSWNTDGVPTMLEMCSTWLSDLDTTNPGRKAKLQSVLDLMGATIRITERYRYLETTMEDDSRDQVVDKLKW